MNLPFSTDQFIAVFTDYNNAIWPMQLLAYLFGAAAIWLALRPKRVSNTAVALILAAFWAFTGIAYHLLSFAPINPAARVFGILFVIEAVLLVWGAWRGQLQFRFAGDVRSWTGLGLTAWSMVAYPLIGSALGHGFPNGPVFGLTPCPLVIFTFGLLLLVDRAPRYMMALPIIWALVGASAAVSLGIVEDISLLASALLWIALSMGRAPRTAHSPLPR